jgi:hypothetical protein
MAVKLGNGKWAVKENNLLAYNDNSGQFFNKEFDFTRGSSATYVGKDGLIKTAGLQDTNLVQNGDFSELGSELVTNGDFSNGTNGWSSGSSTLSVVDKKLKVLATGAFSYARQNITVTSGKQYKITVDFFYNSLIGNIELYDGTTNTISEQLSEDGVITLYVTPNSTNLRLTLLNRNGVSGDFNYWDNVSVKQVDPNDEWNLGSGWSYGDGKAISINSTNSNLENTSISIANGKQYKFTFEITDFTGNGFVRPQLGAVGAVLGTYVQGNGVYSQILIANSNFDRIVLRTGGGDGFNGSVSNVSVQEVQVNTPRIDFSDSADGALLLEPQRTNSVTYSEDFSNSSYGKTNATVTSGFLAPDGSNNATKLVTSAVNGQLLFNGGNGNTSTKSISVFAKANTSTSKFKIIEQYYYGHETLFDLNLGVVEFNNSVGSKIEDYGNGWYKCTHIQSYSSGQTNATFAFRTNTAESLYIWGTQSEVGAYPTSYIPTQGSASTRIAETCDNSGSAQDFNSEEGVLYAEINALSDGNAIYQGIRLSDGGSNNIIIYYNPNSNFLTARLYRSGATIWAVDINIGDQSICNKFALRYNSNGADIFINGVKFNCSVLDSSFSINTLTRLDFKGNAAFPFYGNAKSVQVFTEALSDEELQKLTTI